MRRLLLISEFILILVLLLSLEVADQRSASFLTASEAEAFLGGRRKHHFDTSAEAQTTTQSTEAETETVSEEDSDQPAHGRSRRRGASSASAGGKTKAKSSQEDSPSSVPIGTVVQALPDGCQATVSKGVSYSNCGGTYYRAAFQGSNLVYVVVEKPLN